MHETSAIHFLVYEKWSDYKMAQHTGSIAVKLDVISCQYILENQHYIKSVAQVVGFALHRIYIGRAGSWTEMGR